MELKIITTRVCSIDDILGNEVDDVIFSKGALVFPCGMRTALEVGNNLILCLRYILVPRFVNAHFETCFEPAHKAMNKTCSSPAELLQNRTFQVARYAFH